jgi:hypothetical protein
LTAAGAVSADPTALLTSARGVDLTSDMTIVVAAAREAI